MSRMKFLAVLLVLIMVGAVLLNFAFNRRIERLKEEVKRREGQLKRLKRRHCL
jgi:NADH:ubiquinone oxidoreductase subunit 6 (subunit J)